MERKKFNQAEFIKKYEEIKKRREKKTGNVKEEYMKKYLEELPANE